MEFEYRAVGGKFIWAEIVIALSSVATGVAVDLGELKIIVFKRSNQAQVGQLHWNTIKRLYVTIPRRQTIR